MLNRLDPGTLFLDNLQWIEKVAFIVCHKNCVWGDEAEDFVSIAKMKVFEDDYAVVRKFRGECTLRTYLATVVVQRFHEYARERWGRWRHTAAAERIGQPAKDLEILVHREGYTLREAGEKLRSAGRTTLSDTELARSLDQLPARGPLRPVYLGAEPLANVSGGEAPDERIRAAEDSERRHRLGDAVARALGKLEAEDQLLLRMKYLEHRSVADVARALRLDQPSLYKRIDRLLVRLRRILEEDGISRADVREFFDDER
jgi:RNA polymerase sigma factor for flagellar operon FliA